MSAPGSLSRGLLLAGLLACTALPAFPAPAAARQTATSEQPALAPVTADSASLSLHRREITIFRSALGTRTAAERATAARQRLLELSAAGGEPGAVITRGVPEGVLVLVGTTPVFTLTAGDVAEGETLEGERQRAVEQLRRALAAGMEERSFGALLRGAVLVLLSTVAFVLFLRALYWTRRWFMAHLPRQAGRRLRGLAIGGFSLFSTEQLVGAARRVVQLAAWALGLMVAYLWLAFALTRFAYSRPWGEALGSYLTQSVAEIGGAALGAVPGLFTVVLIVVITRWIARLVNAFFDAVERGGVEVPWIHPETANPTKRIVVVLLWLFAVVVSYPHLPGSGSDVFKGVTVFLGLVISLGSSGVVNQAMGGLVLMYSRALKPGEYVRIGDTEGVVTVLGMLSTKIRTNQREEVTLPNSVVIGASVKNYSRLAAGEGVIVHTSITIGYDTPWRQVEALLLEAARRTSLVQPSPEPFVLRTALSDFYVEYRLNAHLLEPSERLRALSELHGHIVDCFNEHGVQITSPHYESDPPVPHVVPRERWFAAPARAPEQVPDEWAGAGDRAGSGSAADASPLPGDPRTS